MWIVGRRTALGIAVASLVGISNAYPQEKVVRIGVSISLTGALSREGNLGKNAYDLWMETVNANGGLQIGNEKHKVELKYYDDQSDAQSSMKLAERLISQDQIRLILGPFSSGITFAVSNITERNRALLVSGLGNADALYARGYKYLVSSAPTPSVAMNPVLDLWAKQDPKPKRLAIITKDEVFSLSVAEGARAYAPKAGYEVVYFAKFPIGSQDLSTLISQAKAQNPDVVLGLGHVADTILMVRQSKDLGFRPKAWALQVGPEIPEFRSALGKDGHNVTAYTFWNSQVNYKDPVFGDTNAWIKKFAEKYKYEPLLHNALATSAAVLLGEAIVKAGSIDPEKVRAAMQTLTIDTVLGPTDFDGRGVNTGLPIIVWQLQSKGEVLIWPDQVKGGDLVYPLPPW